MLSQIKDFEILSSCNWLKGIWHIDTLWFTTSQFLPTIKAKATLIMGQKDFEEFKKIDNLKVEERDIEIFLDKGMLDFYDWSIPLESLQFVVPSYKVISVSGFGDKYGLNDRKYSDLARHDVIIIELDLVDKLFYKMTLEQKYESHDGLISDLVETLVGRNGGSMSQNMETDFDFRWNQQRVSDLQMVKMMKPFAKSVEGDLLYHFLCFNNEAYFYSLHKGQKLEVNITNMNTPLMGELKSYTFLKEKYLHNMTSNDVKPDGVLTQVGEKIGQRFNYESISHPKARENHTENLTDRLDTMTYVLSMAIPIYPTITCFNHLSVIKNIEGTDLLSTTDYMVLCAEHFLFPAGSGKVSTTYLTLGTEEMD